MPPIDVVEAKESLPQLIAAIESGQQTEIVIIREGKPVARLVPIEEPTHMRIGLLKGKFKAPDDFDALNGEIAKLFGVE